jgi:predicted DNA-binding transcriptional regulator AlpA
MSDQRPWAGVVPAGPFLRSGEAAEYLSLSRTQFYALANAGHLPKPFKLNGAAKGFSGAAGVPKAWLDSVLRARAEASLEPAQ